MTAELIWKPALRWQHSQVSNVYNQVWEARGMDAVKDPGKLVLFDGDGLGSGGKAATVRSKDELMSNPEVLKSFIHILARRPPILYRLGMNRL